MARPAAPKTSIWAEYFRHVGKHWWSLVVGGVGGILTVLSLVTSIVIPLWLGIAVLLGGLFAAQFLAFRDIRQERDRVVKASEVSIGPSPFPRTKLERAVVKSLVAAEEIERERLVQGNTGLMDRLLAWAGETDERLREAHAGKLHAEFRDDGLHPPHGTSELVAYLKRQISLFERALRQLRRDEGQATATPDRVDLLREQYQRGRALQAAPPGLSGPAPASQAEVREGEARRRRATLKWAEPTWRMLRDHFPPREEEFCPYAVRWGHSSFNMAFEEEVDAIHGSSDAYLEQKLAFLANLLTEHEPSGPVRGRPNSRN